uniref:Uncharacterized protein n=1 Tax=Lactuca sativa TaxID=4236 RepID=A0A9R1VEQ0_LACSA|nr:hypothetical protein LSAT_V11C500246700 [Lactuca sativa]
MVLLLPSQLLATKTYTVNVVNNQRSGLQRPRKTQADISFDCKFFVWVDEDWGLHRYKSKVNELNRENMCNARRSGLVNLEAIGVENGFSTKRLFRINNLNQVVEDVTGFPYI